MLDLDPAGRRWTKLGDLPNSHGAGLGCGKVTQESTMKQEASVLVTSIKKIKNIF